MSTFTLRSETGPWAGLATITGGALLAATSLLDATTGYGSVEGVPGSTAWLVGFGLLTVATLLLAIGLAGIVAGLRRRAGTDTFAGIVLGAVGFLLVAVGSGMNVGYEGAAGDFTAGSNFAFMGFLVVMLASLVTGIALWRRDVARTAAASLLGSVVVFVVGFAIGTTGIDATGGALVFLLVNLLLAAGWGLFGHAVRSDATTTTADRVAPVA